LIMARIVPPIITAFEIPLNEKQLLALGRISAIWAQVDFLTDQLLMRAQQLNQRQFDLLVGDKMVGTKLSMLQQSLDFIENSDIREAVSNFIVVAESAKTHRNHAVHGVWGWRISERGEFAAARHSRTPGVPLRAERLRRLEREVASASELGLRAMSLVTGQKIFPGGKFNFGAAEQPPKRFGADTILLPSGRPSPPKKPKGKAAPL
jgi:hypothetical protein